MGYRNHLIKILKGCILETNPMFRLCLFGSEFDTPRIDVFGLNGREEWMSGGACHSTPYIFTLILLSVRGIYI